MKQEFEPKPSAFDGQNTSHDNRTEDGPVETPLIDRLFPELEPGDRRHMFLGIIPASTEYIPQEPGTPDSQTKI